jgi:hypothetical protein
MSTDCAVIVSYYNARTAESLLALLSQIATIDAGAHFDLIVVVNQDASDGKNVPSMPAKCKILYRENDGYNIGAWQHGWLHGKGYRYYLFLQDECAIEKSNWLRAFIDKAAAGYGVIAESLVIAPAARNLHVSSPEFFEQLQGLQRQVGLELTRDLTHAQTTIIFATGATLEKTHGFVVPGNDKIQAIACEVAFSALVRRHGFRIAQLGFLPFEYISHPQWIGLRTKMKTLRGRIRRLVRIVLGSQSA